MPTFRHGRNTRVFIAQYDLSTYFREAMLGQTVDTAETTAYGTFDKTFVVGFRDGTLTLGGMFSGAAAEVDAVLESILGQEAAVVVSYFPEGIAATGRTARLTTSEETTHETSSPIGDVVATSAEMQSTDGAHRGVMLQTDTALSALTNSASVDNAVSSALGGRGNLHVVQNTRPASSTIKVQHSTDDAAWVDLITYAAVGASTLTSEQAKVTGTVNRYTRSQVTPGGASGTITVVNSFARHNV